MLPRHRLQTALRLCLSSRRLYTTTAKPVADASVVVELLLRETNCGGDRNEEELRALVSSSPYTPSHLLQVIRSLPSTDAALRFFDWCRGQQSSSLPSAAAVHGPSAYQAMFELAAREEGPRPPHLRMKDLLDRSTEQGYRLTLDSGALLVRAFCRARMLPDALRVLRSLKPSLRKTPICNDLLRHLFSSGDPHLLRLDTKSYNILIAGFCKKKRLDKVHELLDEMVKKGLKPDDVTFNTLIATSSKAEDFSSARFLVRKMIEKGHKPSVITYGALIHGYCRASNMDEAMNLFRTMDAAGILPNTVIYNTLIDFLGKGKKPGDALLLMAEMQDKGVPPTTATYNAMFKGLKEKNLLDKAYELMDRMKEQGCKPDYITMEVRTEWLPAVGDAARLRSFIQGHEVTNSSM